MDRVQVIEYSGYEIRVFAWVPPGEQFFRATFEIRYANGELAKELTGAVRGAFTDINAAHEMAITNAKQWIDER